MTGNSFSLRRRLLWRLLPSVLLLFAIGGVGAYLLARHYANIVYDSWLYDSAHSLAVVVHRGGQGVTIDLPESSRKLFVWDVTDMTYFKVSGSRSGLVAGTVGIPSPPGQATPYGNALMFDTTIDGRPVRVAALDLPTGDFGEAVQVEVAETEGKRNALARSLLLSLLLPQALLLAVATILIWRGVGRALLPLHMIARQLDQHDHQRLLPLPDSSVPLEVQPLTRSLNGLLARLDKSLAAQRKFITDAAHQLRTPLTGLMLNIEQAQRESDPDKLQRLLAELRISAERATRLSNQMLALARVEPDAIVSHTLETVDLCALVRDAGAEWVTVALRKNIELSFSGDRDKVEVWASPTMLREVINNLVDNAVKYHPGNGTVVLEVADSPRPTISVEDDGPGIPEHERKRVLERFFRLEKSTAPGAGLGLAIVHDIVKAHRAELEILAGASGQGTLVRIRFHGRE